MKGNKWNFYDRNLEEFVYANIISLCKYPPATYKSDGKLVDITKYFDYNSNRAKNYDKALVDLIVEKLRINEI